MKVYLLPLFAVFLCASLKAAPDMPKEIVVGAIYNVFHEQFATDEAFFERVDRDFELMRESSINAVMLFPMSQWNRETGELLWTRTDYMVRKLEELEMGLVPLMFKEEQGRHYIPIWKFQEIEGLWEAHATGNQNSRENVDHQIPEVRALIEDSFKAVIGRYGKSPAMLLYNVWNEPHYVSNSEATVERFRAWLKVKYTDLAGISRAWGEDYTDWSQVTAFLNDNWDSSLPMIDWQIFTYELNGMALQSFADSVRALDPKHPTNANPVGTVWTNVDVGRYTVDNWPLAESVDIHGISYYAGIWERANSDSKIPFYRHSFLFNQARSAAAGKPWMLTELQTNGQNGQALAGFFGYDDLHLLSWTALANNCKAILYWKWSPFMRGRQSFGRGLTKTNGELAPRGEAVADFAAAMKEEGVLLREAQPVAAQVGVLLDMYGLFKSLEPGEQKSPHNFMRESYEGLAKALWEANVSFDALRMDRGLSLDQLAEYKILYLPYQLVVPREVAGLLKEYVAGGGALVADARSAVIDELDFGYEINPGAGLDAVFGVRRDDWIGERRGAYGVQMDDGLSFAGKFFRESWTLAEGVEVRGRFSDTKEPAVTVNRFGNGKAVLSAVPLGGSYFHDAENRADEALVGFAREAGVESAIDWKGAASEVPFAVTHRSGEKAIVYLINYYDEAISGVLTVPGVALDVSMRTIGFGEAAAVSEGIRVNIPAKRALVLVME